MKFRALAIGILLAASSFAADVDGKWTGNMSTPNGDVPVNLTLKADGNKVTGTTSGPAGDIKISDGKMDGDKVTFTVTFDFNGMPLTLNYTGTVTKDQIKFVIDVFGMPLDLLVKRAS
jgi:hypothetical protein